MSKITDLIGNTPLVKIESLIPHPNIEVYAKLEGHNPGGSVKDRAAFGMIDSAVKRGDIKAGDRLVEATSGNTGIALAFIAQQYGLHMTLLMPESATPERVKTMRAYGAEVILTPADNTIEYSRDLALKMSREEGYHMLNQFDNPDNYGMHYRTTGPEIWKDTQGKVTHFVSSMGTTGTIMGVSRYLKEKNPDIQIIGVQPKENSRIPGIRRWNTDFLPKIYEPNRVDKIINVSRDEATHMARQLAQKEGVFAGMSSGGALAATHALCQSLDRAVIVFIACDRGDRYLSSDLYN